MTINNQKKLKGLRKSLRKRLTPAEATLWNYLKNNQLNGRKFRRQQSVGSYILDFYCPEEKLCIELDGEIHNNSNRSLHDIEKYEWLKSQGIQVIRFENKYVFESTESVLNEIKACFKKQ